MEADGDVIETMGLDPNEADQVAFDVGTGITLMENYSSDRQVKSALHLIRESVSLPYLVVNITPETLFTILLDSASSVNFISKESLKFVPHTLGGNFNATIKTISGLKQEKVQNCSITLKSLDPRRLSVELFGN